MGGGLGSPKFTDCTVGAGDKSTSSAGHCTGVLGAYNVPGTIAGYCPGVADNCVPKTGGDAAATNTGAAVAAPCQPPDDSGAASSTGLVKLLGVDVVGHRGEG
eukprot:CAMPEP_0204438508 /NCGR_PEP_ID=MMETSP0470-20130426/79545_1 /ASSEMBLY_ACC=CAM_ASM_000385 /TAXON_ID=2969 /ORGANISM="Oxyrrhis marina" /LENGTH=102 /DNA_ID=CAMNT_0051437341 /DNA_START=69 /DNA_END=374 /DNA_ORIENTATION=+